MEDYSWLFECRRKSNSIRWFGTLPALSWLVASKEHHHIKVELPIFHFPWFPTTSPWCFRLYGSCKYCHWNLWIEGLLPCSLHLQWMQFRTSWLCLCLWIYLDFTLLFVWMTPFFTESSVTCGKVFFWDLCLHFDNFIIQWHEERKHLLMK